MTSGVLVERRHITPQGTKVQQRLVEEGKAIRVARGQDDRVQRLARSYRKAWKADGNGRTWMKKWRKTMKSAEIQVKIDEKRLETMKKRCSFYISASSKPLPKALLDSSGHPSLALRPVVDEHNSPPPSRSHSRPREPRFSTSRPSFQPVSWPHTSV